MNRFRDGEVAWSVSAGVHGRRTAHDGFVDMNNAAHTKVLATAARGSRAYIDSVNPGFTTQSSSSRVRRATRPVLRASAGTAAFVSLLRRISTTKVNASAALHPTRALFDVVETALGGMKRSSKTPSA